MISGQALGAVVRIALRNLAASRAKTFIVGGIIAFGALLVVVGTSLLDSVDHAMSRSIVGSIAGDIQVYSAESKSELELMGGMSMDPDPTAPLADFARVREVLLGVPNVADAIPMGVSGALVMSGNTVDQALGRLRETVTRQQGGDRSAELTARYRTQKAHVQQILHVLGADAQNVRQLQGHQAEVDRELNLLERVSSSSFWETFDSDPLGELEVLENQVAPLAADADMLFLRYVGTDPEKFAAFFDRMRIDQGEAIPPGQRGFLFSKYMYEEQVKLKTARRLDKIREAKQNRGVSIAVDPELQRWARELPRQVKELRLQLDLDKTERFEKRLREFLGTNEGDVGKLLEQFLSVDDGNFEARYDFFYRELAPDLDLYRVRIGDTLTIKAFTRSGYVQSANLKVYGTFSFEGLESSPQAGDLNLMDLVSFRELYGFMTREKEAEIASLRAGAGAQEVSRDNAEALLFGAAPGPAAAAQPSLGTTSAEAATDVVTEALSAIQGARLRADRGGAPYDPADLRRGTFLNAAVKLKDDRQLQETIAAIESAGAAAGIPLKAISWQKAAGLVGQFTVLMRLVLYTAVLIIFVVALVIINNALVMATLERVREIGTLRAIGAQRGFVLAMLIFEAVVTGLIFGLLGACAGAGIIALLGKVGIAAVSDVMSFFFSGPRLHPNLASENLVLALGVVLLVSVASSVYPAWLAMRVSPVRAMAAEE